MKFKIFAMISLVFLSSQVFSQENQMDALQKTLDDDNSKYTNIGNIGLTITNFGTYGHGFSKWPNQPSCEYPIGSGIEHLYDGGLWIGAYYKSNNPDGAGRITGPWVSTGIVDASSVSVRGGGLEFTNLPGAKVNERSSLLDSKFFSPQAISHQDLFMEYSDTNKYLNNGEIITDHEPIGVVVRNESYAWNYPFADFFVIMNYWIKNTTNKYIDSVYVGLWTDAVVRNTNVTSPRTGSTFFNKSGDGYNDSLKIAYEFDATGDIGFTDSYIGIQYLGANKVADSVNFVSWQYRNTSNPNFFAPSTDIERYRKMAGYFGGNNRYGIGIDPAALKLPSNRSLLITAGPFKTIAPGDSINVTFAIVAAKKYGSDLASLDSELQKSNLYANASWAIRAYNGEDRNGNGILDAGEDLDGNGVITRYILPAPPTSPAVKVVPEDQKITIYWDKRAENSVDPISGKKDFEGYRIYRTNAGYDLTEAQNLSNSLVQIAEFDSIGNTIGYNTGFGYVELAEPVTFPNDPTQYYYKFELSNLLNGWQYALAVTAFDEGDTDNKLESLESSLLANSNRVIPGSLPTSNANVKIGVYPNPYYGEAYWDGSSERLRKIYFYNLPADCEIVIYTLSGDIVKRIDHTSTSNGSDVRWFEVYAKDGKQVMTGGEHPWDLVTDDDQAIATGLYLYTVKDKATGDIKTGKFLVIK